MDEANFEFNPEKIYSSKDEALNDILGKPAEDFFGEVSQILGPRASRKAFFLNEAMHLLPEGTQLNKTYKISGEDLGITDLLSYLFDQHNQEEN